MVVEEAIRSFHLQRDRLNQVITMLEEYLLHYHGLPWSPSTRNPRGRKSMGAEEREAVSRRMKKYWANRQREKTGSS